MPADRSRLPPIGPEPPLVFPAIRKTRLPASGLSVWTIEHRTVPLATIILLVPAGAAADPPDRPGLAALTADLLDEGAGERDALALHDAIARLGGRLETDVGADATTLSLTVLARYLDQALELLADIVGRPRFEAVEFSRVRERRLSRLAQLRDLPPAVAERAFAQSVYPGHPYGHLPLGTDASLAALTLEEVIAFHRRAYRLSRTTLIVAGDGASAAVVDAALRAFDSGRFRADELDDEPLPDPARLPVPPPALRVAVVDRPGAAQSEVRTGGVTATRNSPDYHALLVLNTVLGGQFVSRLNLILREQKGYTYGVRSSLDLRRGPGPFVVHTSVETGATAEAVEIVLDEVRAVGTDRPPTDEELEVARAALTRGYPRHFETAAQVARAAAQIALYDLPDDYFAQFVPCVRAVGRDEVVGAARRYLDPDRFVTVVVGDGAQVVPALERAGKTPVVEPPIA
jgi:zinc protease